MSAQDSFGIERGTGEIICTDDSDDTRSADDPSYAVAALWDQMVLGADVCGPQLTPIDGGTWGASKAVAGTDAEGRAATFRLYVLHDRFSWTLGSSTQIRDNDVPVPFSNVLSTPEFFERFCSAKAALALGAASHEGPTAPNHRLAAARGDIVARSLVNYREDCSEGRIPLIYAINLGEHQNTRAAGNTAPQRRVVIVAAEEMTVGVNLEQALRDALVTDTVVDGFSVGDYDLFVVTPF
ncbi:MAG: hypothetical protein AAGB16_01055 [Pseudomonadota bacterium]